MFTVIQDTREKTPWSFLPNFDTLTASVFEEVENVIVKKLDTGDYSIQGLENKLAIERKRSTAEIAGNLCEARFKDVVERLSQFEYKFLICEFNYQDVLNFPRGSTMPAYAQAKTRISANWMDSYLLSLQTKNGIHIIYAGDADNGNRLAYNIMKKVYKYEQE